MGASKLDLDRVGPFLLEVTEEPDGSMIRERERKRANSIRDPPPAFKYFLCKSKAL